MPTPPATDPTTALPAGLRRWLGLAWLVLLCERIWPILVPPLCLAGLFTAIALFDPWGHLPAWVHGLTLATTLAAMVFWLGRGMRRLRWPRRDEAARRLERDSGLFHRPLAVLADHPTGGDPLAMRLWQAHRRRMAATLEALHLAPPVSDMPARDPYGWRAAVLLLLVIALAGAGHDAPRRLDRALHPGFLAALGLTPDTLEVWLTPPAYTKRSPLLLRGDDLRPVAVPAGSTVLAVLSGGWGGARLVLADGSHPFERQSDGSQRVEATLTQSARLKVRQMLLPVASWAVQVTPDALPSVAFSQPPEAGERGRTHFMLMASDDYGLARAWVNMRRLDGPDDGEVVAIPVPLPGGHPNEAEIGGWFDLSAHPWAGLPVAMQPAVADGAGQEATGESVSFTLPERHFLNPIAGLLVQQRRDLTTGEVPAAAVARVLDGITFDPHLFNDDLKVFLMLRLASASLTAAQFDLGEMQDLLWQAATRLEDGDLSSAQRGLQEARAALQQALDQGASDQEIQRLLDRFQQALERFTQALAERSAPSGTGETPGSDDERVISQDELRQMMQGLRDMADTGARDALRQMLDNLSQIIDGLEAGAGRQQSAGITNKGLGQLRDLARQQQHLLDGSTRASQENSKSSAHDAGQSRGEQDKLRQDLETVTRALEQGLGAPPPSLEDARQAMSAASGHLGQGDWRSAAEAQGEALTALQQAARETLEQMAASGQAGNPRDPLGRPARPGAVGDDGSTHVPDHSEIQRVRQLLEEIRRRSAEFQRPESERDYLRRLLKQF